jgi:hypothetical protein
VQPSSDRSVGNVPKTFSRQPGGLLQKTSGLVGKSRCEDPSTHIGHFILLGISYGHFKNIFGGHGSRPVFNGTSKGPKTEHLRKRFAGYRIAEFPQKPLQNWPDAIQHDGRRPSINDNNDLIHPQAKTTVKGR